MRSFPGLLLAGLLVTYGALIARRRARQPGSRTVLHPLLPLCLGLLLGGGILLVPFLDTNPGGGRVAASGSAEWSPAMRAADEVGWRVRSYEMDQASSWPSRVAQYEYMFGWNPLTATLVVRVTNVGVWLVMACGLIWAAILCFGSRTRKASTNVATDATEADRSPVPARWLVSTAWSCLWLGLANLALHAWCRLAMAYCVSRVITQG